MNTIQSSTTPIILEGESANPYPEELLLDFGKNRNADSNIIISNNNNGKNSNIGGNHESYRLEDIFPTTIMEEQVNSPLPIPLSPPVDVSSYDPFMADPSDLVAPQRRWKAQKKWFYHARKVFDFETLSFDDSKSWNRFSMKAKSASASTSEGKTQTTSNNNNNSNSNHSKPPRPTTPSTTNGGAGRRSSRDSFDGSLALSGSASGSDWFAASEVSSEAPTMISNDDGGDDFASLLDIAPSEKFVRSSQRLIMDSNPNSNLNSQSTHSFPITIPDIDNNNPSSSFTTLRQPQTVPENETEPSTMATAMLPKNLPSTITASITTTTTTTATSNGSKRRRNRSSLRTGATDLHWNNLAIDNLGLVGRDMELIHLHQIFHTSSNVSMGLIIGSSGVGKSELAKQFLYSKEYRQQHHSLMSSTSVTPATDAFPSTTTPPTESPTPSLRLIGYGKFEEQQTNHSDPYQAIAQALATYIHQLTLPENKEYAHYCAASLQNSNMDADDLHVLQSLVPNITILMDMMMMTTIPEQEQQLLPPPPPPLNGSKPTSPKLGQPEQTVPFGNSSSSTFSATTTSSQNYQKSTASASLELLNTTTDTQKSDGRNEAAPITSPTTTTTSRKSLKSLSRKSSTKTKMSKKSKKNSKQSMTQRAFQVQNVFLDLIKVLSQSSAYPLTFWLDDLQWAGPAALKWFETIFDDSSLQRNPNFHLLATCRLEYLQDSSSSLSQNNNDDDNDDSSYSSSDSEMSKKESETEFSPALIQLLKKYKSQVEEIRLDGLSLSSVQKMINALLRMEDEGYTPNGSSRSELTSTSSDAKGDDDNNNNCNKRPTKRSNKGKTYALSQIVHKKTHGNPFFVVAFLQALIEEGFLKYQVNTMTWEWFEVEIQSQNIAKNVAEAVAKKLKHLKSRDLFVLQCASCLSRSIDIPALQYVLDGMKFSKRNFEWPINLDQALQVLVQKGILETRWGSSNHYSFAHNQIQHAAFRSIPSYKRESLQGAIGKRLMEGMDISKMDQYLLSAIQLCIKGGKIASIAQNSALLRGFNGATNNTNSRDERDNTKRLQEHKAFAFWTFLAGLTALQQGAFESALKFFNHSVACLGGDPFERDPILALPLLTGAVEAAYATGESKLVEAYAWLVHQQPDITALQKYRITIIEMKVSAGRRELTKTVKMFRQLLKDLGAGKLPKKAGPMSVLYSLISTSRMIKKHDRKSLMELPMCDNAAIEAATDAYSVVSTYLYMVDQGLFVIAACMATQWSLKYGVTEGTPTSLGAMGVLLSGVFNNYDKAMELSETALEMCEAYSFKQSLCSVCIVVYGLIRHCKKPMHEFISPMRYGLDLAIRQGQFDDAATISATYVAMLFCTSIKTIPENMQETKDLRLIVTKSNHDDMKLFLDINLQTASILASPQDNHGNGISTSLRLSGEYMDEDEVREKARQENDVVLEGFTDFGKTQILLYLNASPIEICKAADGIVGFGFTYAPGSPTTPKASFMVGMARILAYKETKRRKHLRIVKQMRKRFVKWMSMGNPNVIHLFHLLEAEMCCSTHNNKKSINKYQMKSAEENFRKAISTSKRTGFKLDYAYANERYAIFLKDIMSNSESFLDYMRDAAQVYKNYHALKKVSQLEQLYPEICKGE